MFVEKDARVNTQHETHLWLKKLKSEFLGRIILLFLLQWQFVLLSV